MLALSIFYFHVFFKIYKKRHGVYVYYQIIKNNILKLKNISQFTASILALRNIVFYTSTLLSTKYPRRILNSKCRAIKNSIYRNINFDEQRVYASFHFGNFYLFPLWLARKGIPIVVVVGDQNEQLQLIIDIIKKNNISSMKIVQTNSKVLHEIRGYYKKGYSIYILIDELGGVVNNSKLFQKEIFGINCRFKKGVNYLGHLLKAHITFVSAEMKFNNTCNFHFLRSLYYKDQADILDVLFSELEEQVIRKSVQWLKWGNFSRFVYLGTKEFQEIKPDEVMKISKKDYRIIRYKSTYFILDLNEFKYSSTNRIGKKLLKRMFKGASQVQLTNHLMHKEKVSSSNATLAVTNVLNFLGVKSCIN